ncbi:hypothetical protein MVEN_00846600 [Mycena venus]|uniref:Uncharacterized protein n=1 Tax=Mycena venus TaxID=2733690 RepID=A0A8H6YGQ8_9AGAR|nr:hypothetical protein MVEN_00846600 [Mycena venus]
MKLSILPLALACTGLLASASPLRVIVVSNGNGNAPALHSDSSLVAHLEPPRLTGAMNPPRPCGGARFRQKVGGFADSIKIAFGFGVSHNNNPHAAVGVSGMKPIPTDNKLHILPFVGTPGQFEGQNMNHPHPHRHGHGHRFHHHGEQPSFLMRVHFALMSLGPWEGRAVAFVLGCGIGVLLRMFWVLVVISYRVIKGPSSHEDDGYTVIDVDAEEIFVAPPTYTYPVDEKVDVVEPVPVVVAHAEESK